MKTQILIPLLLIYTSFSFGQTTSDSLVLYLPFDGNTNDYSGNGNHGTSHFTVSDTNRFGQTGTSLRFNGIDSYVSIPASPSMNLIQKSNKVTISAWINIFQWHVSGNVFSIFERYSSATDAGWLFEANWVGGGYLFLANEINTNWIGCNTPTPFHQWQHVALTYNKTAGLVQFYVNGQMVCEKPYSQDINVGDTTASFAVGRSLAGPDEYSNGLIDDVKVYSRVLKQSEIMVISSTQPKRKNKGLSHLALLPGNPQWTIAFEADKKPAQLQIFDLQGRHIIQLPISPSSQTDLLPRMPSGLYIISAPGFSPAKWLVTN